MPVEVGEVKLYIVDQHKQKGGRRDRGRCEEKEKLPFALLLPTRLSTRQHFHQLHLHIFLYPFFLYTAFSFFSRSFNVAHRASHHFPWQMHYTTPPSPQSRLETNIPFLVAFFHPCPQFLSGYLNSLVPLHFKSRYCCC